ncbi:hypothetical protein [Streptomyces sp. NPDC001070]
MASDRGLLPQLPRLADRSAEVRPADALAVYLRAVAARTARTGGAVDMEVADLLVKARACHEVRGTLADFAACVAELRTEQKRKRNLLHILDGRGI